MNLHAAIQGSGDAVKHRQRVALIIRVFEPTDDRGRGTDKFSQLSLTKTSLYPQSGDFAGNVIVGPSCPKSAIRCGLPR